MAIRNNLQLAANGVTSSRAWDVPLEDDGFTLGFPLDHVEDPDGLVGGARC
jgi:hypothetical protein